MLAAADSTERKDQTAHRSQTAVASNSLGSATSSSNRKHRQPLACSISRITGWRLSAMRSMTVPRQVTPVFITNETTSPTATDRLMGFPFPGDPRLTSKSRIQEQRATIYRKKLPLSGAVSFIGKMGKSEKKRRIGALLRRRGARRADEELGRSEQRHGNGAKEHIFILHLLEVQRDFRHGRVALQDGVIGLRKEGLPSQV